MTSRALFEAVHAQEGEESIEAEHDNMLDKAEEAEDSVARQAVNDPLV